MLGDAACKLLSSRGLEVVLERWSHLFLVVLEENPLQRFADSELHHVHRSRTLKSLWHGTLLSKRRRRPVRLGRRRRGKEDLGLLLQKT
jgi:hypothetical protein